MKHLFSTLCLGLLLSVGLAHAADGDAPKKEPSAAQKAQRERMKTCNAEAKEKALKGDERKTFMKECLSSGKSDKSDDAAAAKSEARQAKADEKAKTKACQKEAKEKSLKGDARKAYISECVAS
ncbi:phosphate starvation-inducible protein PsiF [Betaproteobacteria bacterium]|nr:phosphate starvation-inducible protein PsiF [Betaproteobacteria bacterium]